MFRSHAAMVVLSRCGLLLTKLHGSHATLESVLVWNQQTHAAFLKFLSFFILQVNNRRTPSGNFVGLANPGLVRERFDMPIPNKIKDSLNQVCRNLALHHALLGDKRKGCLII